MANTEQALNKAREALESYPGGWANDVQKCMWDGQRREAIEALTAPSAEAATPVAWMWRVNGWAVTAHGKHRAVKTYVDTCQPPISTQESPEFIELVPLYLAAPQASQPKEVETLLTALADIRDMFPIPERGSELEQQWAASIGCPEEVPGYVAAYLKQQASQPIGQPVSHCDKCNGKGIVQVGDGYSVDGCPECQPVSGAMTDEAWSNVHGANAESILASIMFRANRAKDKGELFAQVELDQIAALAKEGLALLKQERDEIRDHILTGVKGQVQQMLKAQEELLSASGQAVSEKAISVADQIKQIQKDIEEEDCLQVKCALQDVLDEAKVALSSTPAQQTEAQQSDVSAQLRTLSEQAEERRQVEENQYLERIHLGMRDAYGHAAQIVDAAQTQSEKDAERYRWLRNADLDALAADNWKDGEVYSGEQFDAAIDAAIAKEKAK